MSMKESYFGVLILLLSMALILGSCGKNEPDQGPQPARPVKMMDITSGMGSGVIEYAGTISPIQDVSMAFEVPGKLSELPVSEGEAVKKGQLLAKLDDRDYRLAFDAKKAVFDTAVKDYDRAKALLEKQIISRKQYDDFRKAFEVAEADMKSARKKLDDTAMRAPFDGRVARRMMDNFQNIQAKETVMVFQDDSRLKLRVDVPEQDLAMGNRSHSLEEATRNISPKIRLSTYPGRLFPAEFHEISTSADLVTRTFSVTLSFKPPTDIVVLPGMTARLIINRRKTAGKSSNDEMMVPAHAIFSDTQSGACVWLVNAGSMTVSKHPVTIGSMEKDLIHVTSGLKEGDIIAVSGVQQLREGTRVSRYNP
jgi:RND family efflux transporter MFP subunit